MWVRAALLLSALLFVPGLVEQFEVPKAVAIQACGAAAFAAWLVRAPWRVRRPTAFEWALLGWLVVEALATATSESRRMSVFGDRFQLEGLLTSAALAALGLAARQAAVAPGAVRRTIDVALLAAALACVYAMLQVAHLDPLPWSRTSAYGPNLVRPFGSLGHPNLLGVITAAGCAGSAALALGDPSRRWAYAPATLLFTVATALTFSRAAWLGAAAGLGVVATALLLERRMVRAGPRVVLATAAVAAAVVALFWSGGWSGLFTHRAAELGAGGGSSTGGSRIEIWRSTLGAWRARPWLGHGPATYELVFPRYQTPAYWLREWGGLPFHAHSIYLNTLATRGVLGAIASLAVVVAAAVAGVRAWRTAAGGARRRRRTRRHARRHRGERQRGRDRNRRRGVDRACARRARRLGGARARATGAGARAGLDVALALAAFAAVAVGSRRGYETSRAEAYARHALGVAPEPALAAAERAAALAPHDDIALETLSEARQGVALRTGASLAGAETAAARAIDAARMRYQNWQQLGAVLASRVSRGDSSAVGDMEAAYGHAIELAPTSALPMIELARWQILLDRPSRALAPARRAVALYPDEAVARSTLASALLASGERDSARVEIERALRSEWHGNDHDRAAAADVLARLGPPAGAGR
jgi:O-antigen ligase